MSVLLQYISFPISISKLDYYTFKNGINCQLGKHFRQFAG
jgi:hypothetical protein